MLLPLEELIERKLSAAILTLFLVKWDKKVLEAATTSTSVRIATRRQMSSSGRTCSESGSDSPHVVSGRLFDTNIAVSTSASCGNGSSEQLAALYKHMWWDGLQHLESWQLLVNLSAPRGVCSRRSLLTSRTTDRLALCQSSRRTEHMSTNRFKSLELLAAVVATSSWVCVYVSLSLSLSLSSDVNPFSTSFSSSSSSTSSASPQGTREGARNGPPPYTSVAFSC